MQKADQKLLEDGVDKSRNASLVRSVYLKKKVYINNRSINSYDPEGLFCAAKVQHFTTANGSL